jgi:outer membrane autotransporter protein
MLVSGADNAIVAGAFVNDGIVSFVDGSPDDVLTITGDFSGDGAINLDVSGLNQASDQLYVDGNIIESTTQTLNVNLVDAPTTPSIEVPLIGTSGTLAGDFVLGDVHFALDGFVAMDFDLKVADDAVSLAVDVTGLNATGQLAADIAPGVQSLVNAQVGTYRQRMGVLQEAGSAGLGPWMRMFTDSGNVDARYSGNFGAGGLGFHQSNHGWEVGLDTRPSEHIAFGAFIGKSDGSQRVNGAGSNRLDGSTFGLYGTWFGGHGAYVDVSHRWTGVDARLGSGLGTQTTKASAQSLNVEGGFTAWTSAGGFNVVPQLQYTHTRIGDIRTLHSSDSEFANDGGVSSRGRLGVAFDQSFQSGGFTLTPYGSFNVVREFDGDFDHAINGGIEGTTTTSGSSRMVELGMGVRKGGLSVSGGANWTDGGAVDSVTGAQLTVRYNW